MDWSDVQTHAMYLGSPAAYWVALILTARSQVERLGEKHSSSVHPTVTTGFISEAWLFPYRKKKVHYELVIL
jgi:hypothetical protein